MTCSLKLLEEKNIAKALEEQRKSDAVLSRGQLDLELRRLREISDVELEKKLRDERGTWEQELEQRLRRAAAVHADNLEQVVRTQKQLHDIENAEAVDVSAFVSPVKTLLHTDRGGEGAEAALDAGRAGTGEVAWLGDRAGGPSCARH